MNETPTPTGRELEILKLLWELGNSSVRDVHREMVRRDPEDAELAYNTVQTLLRIMEKKGLVSHHTEGRTFVYSPCFSRDQSTKRFLEGVFDGAVSELVLTLLRTERIPAKELGEMEVLIAEARRRRSKRGGTNHD